MIIGMILDAEIQERDPIAVERRMIRLVSPIVIAEFRTIMTEW